MTQPCFDIKLKHRKQRVQISNRPFKKLKKSLPQTGLKQNDPLKPHLLISKINITYAFKTQKNAFLVKILTQTKQKQNKQSLTFKI